MHIKIGILCYNNFFNTRYVVIVRNRNEANGFRTNEMHNISDFSICGDRMLEIEEVF